MKFQFSIRDLLLIIVIAALAAGWWIDHQRINHIAFQQWDYTTMARNTPGSAKAELNKLAAEGWELCGVSGGDNVSTYVLRRPAH